MRRRGGTEATAAGVGAGNQVVPEHLGCQASPQPKPKAKCNGLNAVFISQNVYVHELSQAQLEVDLPIMSGNLSTQ